MLVGLFAVAGCGGGERQDANEPEGDFEVEVLDASFPSKQQIAETSKLTISVRNAGSETIPDVALTLNGLFRNTKAADVTDPRRPVFVIDGVPVEVGGYPDVREAAPSGCYTAYVNTWACGPLEPGAKRAFRWTVTAVEAGEFKLDWRVAAGVDGRARAVAPDGGEAPTGKFAVSVSGKAPQSRIADDGVTVLD